MFFFPTLLVSNVWFVIFLCVMGRFCIQHGKAEDKMVVDKMDMAVVNSIPFFQEWQKHKETQWVWLHDQKEDTFCFDINTCFGFH